MIRNLRLIIHTAMIQIKKILKFPLITTLILLIFVSSCSQSPQKSLLELSSCQMPCWNGISPGKTSMKEALDILANLPFVGKSTLQDKGRYLSYDNVIYFWIYPKSGEKGEIINGGAYILGGNVVLLSFSGDLGLSLKDVIDQIGEPESVYGVSSGQVISINYLNSKNGVWMANLPDAIQTQLLQFESTPETELHEIGFFAPANFETIWDTQLLSMGFSKSINDIQPWNGYGNLDLFNNPPPPASPTATTTQATQTITATPTPQPTSTPEPTSALALQPFPTPLAGSPVTQHCPQPVSQFSEGRTPEGFLLLSQLDSRGFPTGEISSLNLASGKITLLQFGSAGTGSKPAIWAISPDRSKYVYFLPAGSAGTSQLHIRTASWVELSVPYWDQTWPGNAFWLDDSRLQIPFPNGDGIILNTITGAWQKLALPAGFQDPISLFHPGLSYNAAASSFLYLAGNDDQVLYDIRSGQEIWRRGWAADAGLQAAWSQDRQRFIANINTGGLSWDTRQTDLYLVNAMDGSETLLTAGLRLAYAPKDKVYPYSLPAWSPDMRLIAYPLSSTGEANSITPPTFVVQDLETGSISEYCLPVLDAWLPVFSPDGKYLAFESPDDYLTYYRSATHPDQRATILIYILNLETNEIAAAAQNVHLRGWLKPGP